jgi:2-oxoacid:acceptor oxidoreductase gamma subunit (pyruvate/2-ketoisovalerate family)
LWQFAGSILIFQNINFNGFFSLKKLLLTTKRFPLAITFGFSDLFRKMYMEGFPIRLKDSWRVEALKKIVEVRWHGRGGQGAWTASELLARAAIYEGKHIQSFPEFGPERMGAPVTAFTRISTDPIRKHCAVYNPDVVAVLDPTLLKAVPFTDGLDEKGTILINSKDNPAGIRKTLNIDKGKVWTVPATEIAIKILGAPITNTAMLGAVARVTGIVNLKSVEKVVKERFRQDIAEKNFAVIREASEEVKSE